MAVSLAISEIFSVKE